MTDLNPMALATIVTPMPVLPAVPSMMVPPGLSSPRAIASRMMNNAARSLTDWPGFMNSAFPRIVHPVSSEALRNLIRGVLPIAAMVSCLMSMCLLSRFFCSFNRTVGTGQITAACPARSARSVKLFRQPQSYCRERVKQHHREYHNEDKRHNTCENVVD